MRDEVVWNVYQLSFLKFDVIVSKQFCPFNDFFNVTQYKEVIVKKKSLLVRHGGMQIWIWFFKRIHFWNNWSIDGIYAGYTWPGVTVKSYFCSKLNVMKNKPNNTILCYYSYHLKSHPLYSPCEYRYIYVCIFFFSMRLCFSNSAALVVLHPVRCLPPTIKRKQMIMWKQSWNNYMSWI